MFDLWLSYSRRLWIGVVILCILLVNSGIVDAGPRIGFLAVESSSTPIGLHNQAAWQVSKKLGRAALLLRRQDGCFIDTLGKKRLMSDFDILWYHQGDAIARNAMYHGPSLEEIRRFATNVCGVLLSGGALAMVAPLGLETVMRPQRHELGNWGDPAGMIPVEKAHLAFSGLETGEVYQFGDYERGHPLCRPEQPVVRVSWHQAMAFCEWLSSLTGLRFILPTEAQWEYACRSGSKSPLWYGTLDDDFSRLANLSDATNYTVDYPHVPAAIPPWRPADTRFDDGWRVSAPVGAFQPNPWGLFDMHGNVAEWTRSTYSLYSLTADHDRNNRTGRKTVRGGSWLDRPRRARSAFRMHYEPSQIIHDVGFRVVCEEAAP